VAKRKSVLSPQERLQIVAGASHDLRQPLQVIGLAARSLRGRTVDPEQQALTREIETAARELHAIAEDLLETICLDAGSRRVHARAIALQTVFEELAAAQGPAAQEKELALRTVPSELLLVTDPDILSRALTNLVANAVKYAESGGVLIGARRKGEGVSIEVWDTGIGILEADLPQLFEPFVRGANRAPRSKRGAGLGLSIVRRLAELLGGTVSVHSRRGYGSVFKLWLPGPVEKAALRARIAPLPAARTGQLFVAILDDDAAVLEATRRAFEEAGCLCLACTDALEFLTRLSQHERQPDLFVLDLIVGPMFADHILHILRTRFGNVQAVIVTGNAGHEKAVRLRAEGWAVIAKPLQPGDVQRLTAT
jgi:two-component system CheB/CheR fusion protein